jgi:histone H3/H4
VNLGKLIPDNCGQLESSDLALSEGRIARILREEMSDEQTLDGDAPHVINCVLSKLLEEIVDQTMKEGEMMHKIKEAHVRSALRRIEIEEEYSATSEAFIDQLRSIADEMEKTADRLED